MITLHNNNTNLTTINNLNPNSIIPDSLDQSRGAIHFIGIGGIGMSGLAKIMLALGFNITGSDKAANSFTLELENLGAKIFIGHSSSNISNQQLVVVSTAITSDNPELWQVQQLKIPVWHRSKLLNHLSKNKNLIGVSGTHGKTTTTGMISKILLEAQKDPSIIIGGYLSDIKSNARHGNSNYFVAEIDESDKSHIDQQSYISVITNLEADHLENYPGGIEDIYTAMLQFANNSQNATVLCTDNQGCVNIIKRLQKPVITYGYETNSFSPDFYFKNINLGSIEVFHKNNLLGELNLKIPGHHNKLNALAAIAVCQHLDISFADIKKALADFSGVGRRFEIKGHSHNVLVVDDYAHHPTEVKSTIEAAYEFMEYSNQHLSNIHPRLDRLVIIFQPHQPKRLQDLFSEFCECFARANIALIADVYIARGKSIPNVNSANLVGAMEHKNAFYLPGDLNNLKTSALDYIRPHDLVITMGAGDITNLGEKLLQSLNQAN